MTEYAGKKILLGDGYSGITCTKENYEARLSNLKGGSFVVKVDVGIKKRNEKGLVVVNVPATEVTAKVSEYLHADYERVLVEEFVVHEMEAERYISIELTRNGFLILMSEDGGVLVEEGKGVSEIVVPYFAEDISNLNTLSAPAQKLVAEIIKSMKEHHLVFVEINPYVETGDSVFLLDMATQLDSEFLSRLPAWVNEHVVGTQQKNEYEQAVQNLSKQSPATFALKVLSENASIYTLLSGGGASLVTLDTLVHKNLHKEIGNYGEYSGAPNREETKLYTDVILKLLLASKAEHKVLFIVGGVANFTDISTTFSGVVDALAEQVSELQRQKVTVVVRRGGPRQKEGLALIQSFLESACIPHLVESPKATIAEVSEKVYSYLYD